MRGRRLWMLWNPQVYQVDIQHNTAQTIHAKVINRGRNKEYWITFVYGFNKITSAEISPFQECVQHCGIEGLKAVGTFFTWTNKQEAKSRVYSRIDRVLINDEWLQLFPESFANFFPEGLYDHCPCIIQLDEDKRKRNVPFRYFNMWAKAPEFKHIVTKHWNVGIYGTPMYTAVKRMKAMKSDLKKLNRNNFHDNEKNAHIMLLSLHSLQAELRTQPQDVHLIEAERKAADGDRQLQEARNAFLLQKSKAQWLEEGDDNTTYFHSVLKKRRAANKVVQIEDANGRVLNQVQDINEAFESYYKNLLGMSNNVKRVHIPTVRKGKILNAAYITSLNQPVTREEIKQDFFHSSKLLKQVNNTTLTLIPKLEHPKNDMLKALNFPNHFIHLLMECVTTPHYSLSLNGELFRYFQGKRGLRQGDSLSPLLFTVCLEYLSRILNRLTELDGLKHHPLCKKLNLTHLCFADDLLVFCRGDWASMVAVMRAFATFTAASELQMNKQKANVYGNGLPSNLLERFAELTGLKIDKLPFKYLGVPISVKKLFVLDCNMLVEKVVDRIRSLGTKKLSYAGRLVLSKSVLSTLHSY
ncbi:uncharacterized protein LOC141617262 [Silene latifolia]|uniref:uncharacterized protein LOC141617262 n=1 Tax=Silene latifolia TaxID=37657 RepID=UPI003D76DB6C